MPSTVSGAYIVCPQLMMEALNFRIEFEVIEGKALTISLKPGRCTCTCTHMTCSSRTHATVVLHVYVSQPFQQSGPILIGRAQVIPVDDYFA